MLRKEYLSHLEQELVVLFQDDVDEIAKSLQYYSDYFEEINDDEKVIAELGDYKDLAASIYKKKTNLKVVNSEEKIDEKSDSKSSEIIYYSYNRSDVRSVSLHFGAAEVVAIPGDFFEIETRGLDRDSISCELTADGNLSVVNTKRINFNFWSHDHKARIVPRILITIPVDMVLNRFKVIVDAGSFEAKDISLSFLNGCFEVGAGNLVLKNVKGGLANIRCGMGNLHFEGSITGRSNIDCGMGSIKLLLNGNKSDYSYDARVGLGNFRFNDFSKNGVCQINEIDDKKNRISVNCGMGNVNIQIS